VGTRTIRSIEVTKAITNAEQLLNSKKKEERLTVFARATIVALLEAVTILSNRLNLDSSNSSLPSSKDPLHRNPAKKKETETESKGERRKPGAQPGHPGTTLKKVTNPDVVETIHIDRRTIPKGSYETIKFETRQVFDINISMVVTEYQAEVVVDLQGNEYVATFPPGVTRPTQYGNHTKASSVYLSQYQLVPLERVKDYFEDQAGSEISKGSIAHFNVEASQKLDAFVEWAKNGLQKCAVAHSDETSINVGGKTIWLHSVSNSRLTLYHPDEKRGKEAMDRMGVLPLFTGTLCHDHWKPYFKYPCTHSLCNAHHLRELQWSVEFEDQSWAKDMKALLIEINDEKISLGSVSESNQVLFDNRYMHILTTGKLECPVTEKIKGEAGKARGRTQRSKSRNLLERLLKYKDETLRFMRDPDVPFTNNQGERDIRMTKVQQKISGCFRSIDGANTFCRIRSYISTCKKNGFSPTEALKLPFDGTLPAFVV